MDKQPFKTFKLERSHLSDKLPTAFQTFGLHVEETNEALIISDRPVSLAREQRHDSSNQMMFAFA